MAQHTKKAIMASFLRLINEKPLSQITVKDIVEDCGVNRKTFYYYFQDIFALVDEVFLAEIQRAASAFTHDMAPEERIRSILLFLLSNKKAALHLYNSASHHQIERYLSQVGATAFQEYLRYKASELSCTQEDIALLSRFYASATTGMMLDWISRGMEGDPAPVIHRLCTMLRGTALLALQNASQG